MSLYLHTHTIDYTIIFTNTCIYIYIYIERDINIYIYIYIYSLSPRPCKLLQGRQALYTNIDYNFTTNHNTSYIHVHTLYYNHIL